MMTTINNVVCLCLFQKLDTTQPSMARDWRTGPIITMPSRSAAACTSYVVGWLVVWLVTFGYCGWLHLVTAELSPKRHWPKYQEVGERGRV